MKLVIHNGSRVWGGNEKWLLTLAVELRARGHDIVVSCRAGAPLQERLDRNGVATSSIRPGGDVDVAAAIRFARWLREERPDALLLTSWNRIPWAVWAARRARVPRVVVRLGIVRSLPRRGRYTRAFRRVNALIVNAAEIKAEWLRSAPWFPHDSVHVVLNGIVPPAPVDDAARNGLRQQLGLPPEVRLVAGAGHVTQRKGFDLLLNAYARLQAVDAHLVVVGSGPQEAQLRAQADALGITPRVHWLGHRTDVIGVLAQCDVFVLSSRNEGMANVMLEAMAVAVPVVATQISGVHEALDAVRTRPPAGWVVPPEDPVAMTAAIEQVLAALRSEPELVHKRVAEALYRIRSWFSVARMADEAERVIFHAAATRNASTQ